MKNQIHAVYYEKHKAVMTRALRMCNIYLSNEIVRTEKDQDDTQNEARRRRINQNARHKNETDPPSKNTLLCYFIKKKKQIRRYEAVGRGV